MGCLPSRLMDTPADTSAKDGVASSSVTGGEASAAVGNDGSFPTLGITTQVLERLLRDPRFEQGMTTTDVCHAIVQPDTRAGGTSYATMLQSEASATGSSADVGPAAVFVSHAWSYDFVRLVDAVSFYATEVASETPGPVYLWLDVLVVDQNNASVQPHDWWSSTCERAGQAAVAAHELHDGGCPLKPHTTFTPGHAVYHNIAAMGHVAAVVMPYDSPVNLRRAWVSCSGGAGWVSVTFLLQFLCLGDAQFGPARRYCGSCSAPSRRQIAPSRSSSRLMTTPASENDWAAIWPTCSVGTFKELSGLICLLSVHRIGLSARSAPYRPACPLDTRQCTTSPVPHSCPHLPTRKLDRRHQGD